MLCLRAVVLVVAVSLLGGAAFQDSKKSDEKPAPTKLRGTLPAYYKKLGLRDDQVQKIYKIRADYKARMDDLDRQIKKLRAESNEATEKVLTPEQQKRLRELRLGEKPSDK